MPDIKFDIFIPEGEYCNKGWSNGEKVCSMNIGMQCILHRTMLYTKKDSDGHIYLEKSPFCKRCLECSSKQNL